MKRVVQSLAALVVAAGFSVGALADEKATMHEAEVKKVLIDKSKITLKHGELKDHNMPPMTMMFKVKDASMLQGLEKGDQVEFSVDDDLVVQEIKKKQ